MLGMALALDLMMSMDVSVWVQALVAAFGIYLIVMAWLSLKFDERRAEALETAEPVAAAIEVTRMTHGDTAAYLAYATVNGETWTVPLRISRRVRKLVKQGDLDGEAWFDPEGRLVALACEGEQLRVMPFPRRKKSSRKKKDA